MQLPKQAHLPFQDSDERSLQEQIYILAGTFGGIIFLLIVLVVALTFSVLQ